MHILTISGSLPRGSSNVAVLDAFADHAPGGLTVSRSISIDGLPHFNPDLESDDADVRDGTAMPVGDLEAVGALRRSLAAADAVVIATPEYAHSFPGVLKNALDWIVGSGELYGKPVAILCASPRPGGGQMGRGAIEQTLRAQGAQIVLSETVTLLRSNDRASELTKAQTTAIFDAVLTAFVDAVATETAG